MLDPPNHKHLAIAHSCEDCILLLSRKAVPCFMREAFTMGTNQGLERYEVAFQRILNLLGGLMGTANSGKFNVSEIMDSFGVSKFTWFMFFILGFAMIFDGYDYMIVSYTLKPAAISLGVADNPVLTGSLSSWSLFGLIIGGAISGVVSDAVGRKRTLVGAIFIYSLLTLPQAFAQNFYFFATFRVLAGIGLGACIPTVTTCFTESTPTNRRAIFVTFGMAFMVAGWMVAGLVGNAISNYPEQIIGGFDNWRLCYIIGAFPLLYSILIHFIMHDTPHWLANKGRNVDAVARLAQIEKMATGAMVRTSQLDPENLALPPKPKKSRPAALFSKKYIMITCGVWSAYFLGQFIVYGLNAWLPTMMTSVTGNAVAGAGLATWQNAAAILSNVTCGFISEAVGRKKALMAGWVGSFVIVILVSWGVLNYEMLQYWGTLVIMVLLGYAVNYTITCVQPMMAEAYPTEFRNTGVAWCQAFARFGGALAPMVLGGTLAMLAVQAGVNLAAGGSDLVPIYSQAFLILTVPCVLGAITTMIFVRRETKGKSLEELQNESEKIPTSV